MDDCWRRPRALPSVIVLACMLLEGPAAASPPDSGDDTALRQLVAVAIVRRGEAIVLATPGLPSHGRLWRFRSFDTRDLPQPIRSADLSASGTKLFVQPEGSAGGVLDLTRQYRHNATLQYVTARDLASGTPGLASTHRLPSQRFMSVHQATARVVDEWAFPSSFLRTTYGLGPRRGMYTIGVGYAGDLDRMPALGRVLPLPGRIGLDGFYWHQDVNDPDIESCIRREEGDGACDVPDGFGWEVRYEQFVSNLFGIFSAVRFFTSPAGNMWITFGPLIETPIGRRSNLLVSGGLSFRPYSSPRFELKMSVGLWKPKTNDVGMKAGADRLP